MPRVHVRDRFRLGATLAAAGCMVAIAIASPEESFGATPMCTTSSLALEFVNGQGATSHRIWNLALRNLGAVTCHLRGYPGVGLLSSSARLMNVPVDRVSSAVRTIVLHPWDRAFFTFAYVVSGPCAHGIFPFGIQVIPPNSTQGLRMYRRFDVCAGSRSRGQHRALDALGFARGRL